MYRGASELERTFGVDAGRYTGAPRTVSLRRAPADVRARLAAIVDGTERPRPIYLRKTGYSWLWGLIPFISLLLLGCIGFGAKDRPLHGPLTLLLYAPLAIGSVFALLHRLRGASGISDGTYLLPLDLVEIAGDRATVWPLGNLAQVKRSKLSLHLHFRDGTARELACESRAEVREAYDELVRAHDQLVTLTYATDEAAALAADPFHSLRVDDSWTSAKRSAPVSPRARVIASIVLGTLAAMGFVELRNRLSKHDADNAVGRWTMPTARPATTSTAAPSSSHLLLDPSRVSKTPDALLTVDERARVDELIARGEASFAKVAATKPEGPSFVRDALQRGRSTGKRTVTVVIKNEWKSPHAKSAGQAAGYFEDRVFFALKHAFAEHFSPAVLRLEPSQDFVKADLVVSYVILHAHGDDAKNEADALAEGFEFNMRLRPGSDLSHDAAKPSTTFILTMPPAAARPALRANTLFPKPNPETRHLMAARAFDRLYDELYGIFFSGAVRVPLADDAPYD